MGDWLNRESYRYKFIRFVYDAAARGYCRPQLWYRYADQYQGCCLVFGKREFDREFEKIGFRENRHGIKYCTRLVPPKCLRLRSAESITDYFNQNIRKFCFTKHADWKSEKEYRYLVKSIDDVSIPIRDSLQDIYVGCRMDELQITAATEKIWLPIKVHQLSWNNSSEGHQ
jgi:hypothetical protein